MLIVSYSWLLVNYLLLHLGYIFRVELANCLCYNLHGFLVYDMFLKGGSLVNRVRELRRRAGLGQKEIASIIGVSRPTVSEWETGRKTPTGDRLKRLAELFDVSTGVVLGYEEVPNPVPVVFVDDGDPEANQQVLEARELVRRDPERGILFSMASNADIKDVRRAIAIIQALESTDLLDADTELSD